jgi:2-C-methyl-D-erythritol 4-phosphate cytidylyltransferase
MGAPPVWAVVVAGGSGSRYGRPKQFDLLAGRPVVAWSVAAARSVAGGVVLVAPPGREDDCVAFGADVVVTGGATRSASVRSGLAAVPEEVAVVVVHDAARPLASHALFAAVVEPLLQPPAVGAGGMDAVVDAVVCAVPVADTLKRVGDDGATVAGTVDRAGLVAVQTPQAFRAGALRRAHAAGADATDDAALVEALGGVVRVVPGEAHNVKVTLPSDLALLEVIVASAAPVAP